jgi:3-oxoacyl-[acyl-carrier protein] reductase
MGRVFLVSGISSGIGQAFAELVVQRGDALIAIVRNSADVSHIPCQQVLELDFNEPECVEAVLGGLSQPVDVFVNFAGVLLGKSFEEYTAQDYEHVFRVHAITPALVVKSIAHNIRPNGSIILLGSISAQKGSFDDGYAAAKGAVHSLVKSLSLKFAPRGIRVIGFAPGLIAGTRMTQELKPGIFEKHLQKIPLGMAGEPADLAQLIYCATEPFARFMTGSVIDVNGGQYVR